MVTDLAEHTQVENETTTPSGRRRPPSAGWLALIFTLAVIYVVMRYYGVSDRDQAMFAVYSLGCVTLPGTLIWRALQRQAGYLPFDVAFGTTAGFVIELPVYLVARAAGVPLAVLAWPIATIVAFTAVPALRRFWRGSGERLPLGTSWTAALGISFTMWTAGFAIFRYNSLDEPNSATMHMDFPFQFALVGVFKHDVPVNTPWLYGTELLYHWYAYAHGAAASWITGIEPQVMIMRLMPVPIFAAFLVLVLALVHRITGRWWPGNLAVPLMLFGTVTLPFVWTGRPMDPLYFLDNLWVSASQTFAALFCVAVVYLLCDLFRASPGELRRPVPWLVLIALVGALAGAKATFLPMLICGLGLVMAVRVVLRRKRPGREVFALLICLAWMAFAQVVLFGSGSQGTEVNPFQTVKYTVLGKAVMGPQTAANPWKPILVLTGVAVIAVLLGWAGMVGLLRRRFRNDPIVQLMFGFALSGLGALYALAHPGLSQSYFGRSAAPYFGILAAVGMSALLPPGKRPPRRFFVLSGAGIVASAVLLVVVRQTLGKKPPADPLDSWTLAHAIKPYVVLFAALAALTLVVALAGRFLRLGRLQILAAMALTVATIAVASGVANCRPLWDRLVSGESQRDIVLPGNVFAMPPGAIAASRWLRDHSDPRDLVATNSHCRTGYGFCDSRDFWLAAFSERQVIIEGWSYTEPSLAGGGLWDRTLYRSKFWDPALLTANDQVFTDPTAERVTAFTREHNVRWLVAVSPTPIPDPLRGGATSASPELARYATERFKAGNVTVYEVPAT
ncbi:hypothetical protein AB0M02_05545 [Actinoplanes sp. NPDC051861]|uniref:hypothetical protein n=1 Tax=Actinoplanes sp. NPDC051861 TaxID=3155170 RepID=UPI003427FAAC